MTATMPGVTERMADRAVTKEIIRRMENMPKEMTVNLSEPGVYPPYSAGAMPRKLDNVLKGLLSISVWLVLYLQQSVMQLYEIKGIFRYYIKDKTWFLFVCLSIDLV